MGKVTVRRGATLADLDEMLRVEHEAWPEEQAFTREHFESHLEVFPEGIFIAEVDGVMAGVGVSEIIRFDDEHPVTTWYAVSDDGYLRKSHDPKGNVLYGVSLSASQRFASLKLGGRIVEAVKNAVCEMNLQRLLIGSRIPRFHRYASRINVVDYINTRRNNRYIDPEIEFYRQHGLYVITVLSEYFDDPESLNYGVLMAWDNPRFTK